MKSRRFPHLAALLLSPYPLLLFIPVAAFLSFGHREKWAFLAAGMAIIPLAGLMGRATEEIAIRLGSGLGGLLNATFGNAAELIIAFMALRAGNTTIVKASITGSIIGNILLVLGLAVFVGGIRHGRQTFNLTAASASASMMLLSVCALAVPALFHIFVPPERLGSTELDVSTIFSVILLLLYGCNLLFSLKTHRHLFHEEEESEAVWGRGRAILVLAGSTILVAWMAEILVHTMDRAVRALGFNETFIGVVIIAIIGNVAEHSTAVLMAWRNRMNLAFTIALESSKQIALFVAPVLVLSGEFLLPADGVSARMNLDFSPLEVAAVTISVFMITSVVHDGETNWFEGALMLGVYALLGAGFFVVG